jgi:serine/threonine protein kinase
MPPTSIKDDEGFKGLFPRGALIHSRYEILSEGKMGGMGMVYKCRDTRHKTLREVALKLMQPKYLDSKDAIERFQHEASISRDLLHHQNIVRVYHDDQWEDENGVVWHYLLMEWIEGRSLRDLLNKRKKLNKPFTSREAYRIISQIAAALSYAHDRKEKVIHRDIKPENILITDEETLSLKVVDFGIAKILNLKGLTELSTPLGVSPYMSPELKLGSREVDHRTDIYSVGVVLYELLTLDGTIGPYRPSELNNAATQDIDNIYKRAVAPRVELRYQTVKALSDDLLAEVVKETQAPPRKNRFRGAVIAIIAVILLAGIVAAYGGYENRRRQAAREQLLAAERQREQEEKERLTLEQKAKPTAVEKEVKAEAAPPEPAAKVEKSVPPKPPVPHKDQKWRPLVKRGPPIYVSRLQEKQSAPAQGPLSGTEPARQETNVSQEITPRQEVPAKREAPVKQEAELTTPRKPQPPPAGFAPAPPRPTAEDYFQRGLEFAKSKDYLQSLNEFSRALEINPSHEPSHYWRGVAYYRLNNYTKAIDDFTIAINLAPRYLYFHWRGATYFRVNNCSRAVEDFTRALRLRSTSIDYNFRGACYQKLGRYAEAEADYRKAAEAGHSSTGVRNNP